MITFRRALPHLVRTCDVCGRMFLMKPSTTGRLCSRRCAADAQRGTGEGRAYRKLMGRHEHRVVAEQKLGRPLARGEVVHHIDGDIHNNAPENLAVMTQGEHMRLHGLGIPGVRPPWEPWRGKRSR